MRKNVIKEVMKKVHNKDYEGVEGVVDKVEMEAADYTDKDWKKADLKFSDLSTDLYAKFEEELNADEKAEIIKLQATYAGLKMKAGVKDAAKKVDKFLDGLKEGTK